MDSRFRGNDSKLYKCETLARELRHVVGDPSRIDHEEVEDLLKRMNMPDIATLRKTKQLYTPIQVAEKCGVEVKIVRDWLNMYGLRRFGQKGRQNYILHEDLVKFAQENRMYSVLTHLGEKQEAEAAPVQADGRMPEKAKEPASAAPQKIVLLGVQPGQFELVGEEGNLIYANDLASAFLAGMGAKPGLIIVGPGIDVRLLKEMIEGVRILSLGNKPKEEQA